ncbi:MAG: hypothetical protein ACKOZU_10420 [Planctomycetaceae bacterium]
MPSSRKATTRTSGWIERPWRGLALAAVATAAVAAGVGLMTAAEPPVPGAALPAGFMRAKLAHSATVLEGLSLEDYDLIGKGAQQLELVSQDASWQVLQTEDYARHSEAFRRACDGLRRAAREKNLDAAVLCWMDVTMKCVQCHRYVRDVEREGAGAP